MWLWPCWMGWGGELGRSKTVYLLQYLRVWQFSIVNSLSVINQTSLEIKKVQRRPIINPSESLCSGVALCTELGLKRKCSFSRICENINEFTKSYLAKIEMLGKFSWKLKLSPLADWTNIDTKKNGRKSAYSNLKQ